jgi:hypothetical protein
MCGENRKLKKIHAGKMKLHDREKCLVGSFSIILKTFAEKTPKFRTKEAPGEKCFYIIKSFKETGTLDMPVSS